MTTSEISGMIGSPERHVPDICLLQEEIRMYKTKRNFFRRSVGAALSVMAVMSCLAISAFAVETDTALGEPPLEPKTGLEIGMDVQVAGKTGNWYDSGDLIILTASVENHTEYPVSGDLWLTFPDSGCTVVAKPALALRDGHEDGVFVVDDLKPGMGAEAVHGSGSRRTRMPTRSISGRGRSTAICTA